MKTKKRTEKRVPAEQTPRPYQIHNVKPATIEGGAFFAALTIVRGDETPPTLKIEG